MRAPKVIQGRDGPLEIDEQKRIVTKTYSRCKRVEAVQRAQREVAYATRLRQSLLHVDGLNCPRILAWEESFPPRVFMQYCPGEPLSRYLRRHAIRRTQHVADIARKIHDGLEIYTRVFDEPYYDFCFQNMLYDESTGVLTVLDFGVPRPVDAPEWPALETSLGRLVGWACYDLVRPSRRFLPKKAYLDVLKLVLSAFQGEVSKEHVRELAYADLRRLGGCDSSLRSRYYQTVGKAIMGRYWIRLRPNSISETLTGESGTDGDNHANIVV